MLQPNPTGEMDSFGELTERNAIPHPVWAVRKDSPSPGEGLIAGNVEGGTWQRRYEVRRESLSVRPTEDWALLDEEGVCLRIVGVFEKNSGARARWLTLVCERQTTAGLG